MEKKAKLMMSIEDGMGHCPAMSPHPEPVEG